MPDDNPALRAALDYASRGWRVVPILRGQKRPPFDEWQRKATTDEATIQRWFKGAAHGVGIATGAESGIFALDIDVANGKHGDETLADLEATYEALPPTREHQTGSGGRHLFFKIPPGVDIRNDAGVRLGPGLDIRGEGGQVLAPPTVHPNGTPYAVELSSPDAPADPPGWLIALLTRETEDRPRAERVPYTGDPRPGDVFAASVTWPELLTRDGATFLGQRRDRSGVAYEMWARPGVDDHAGATLYYGGTDLLKVFTSSWPGLTQDATYTRFGFYAARWHGGDHGKAARELAGPFDIDSLLLEPMVAEPVVVVEPTEDDSPFIVWPRFWEADRAEEQWIAYPVLPATRQIALFAPAKTGKSLLALDIAAGIATGKGALGGPPCEPTSVMYLDYEMTEADLQERLEEMGYGPETDLSQLHYALLPSLPPLDTKEGAYAVAVLAHQCDAQLVVVDTLGRAVQGDENDADTIRSFFRHTGTAMKQAGRTLLRTDHAGKDIEKGQRGTSAKNDDVDVVWKATRTDDGLLLKRTHSRVRWVPETVAIEIRDDPLRHTVAQEGWPAGTKETARDLDALGLDLNVSRRAAAKALKDAGKGARAERLAAALKYRREAVAVQIDDCVVVPEWSGTTPSAAPREPLREPPSSQPLSPAGTTAGTTGNHLPSLVVPGSPSLRGEPVPDHPPDDDYEELF